MQKSILTIPDDDKKLRQVSKKVKSFDKTTVELITNLTDTCGAQKDPLGLGLSAPQIGIFKRVFVARIRNKIKSFINPKILKLSKQEVTIMEGCLSIPELYGHIVRPAEIDLKSQDMHGKSSTNHYKGLTARIIQHELDHLNGILFIDHVHSQNGKMFKVQKDKNGKDQFIEMAYA